MKEEKEMLVCSKCGAEISKKDFEYTKMHDGAFPDDDGGNTVHIDNCGCRYPDEDHSDACHCEFIEKKELTQAEIIESEGDPIKFHVRESEGHYIR